MKNKKEDKKTIITEDILIIEDFLGNLLIVCPYQFKKCEHQFSMGDGAFLGCTCDECYETKKCIKYEK